MSDLFNNINARTKLAGTNKLEILMFTLGVDKRSGRRETYGINVFKVREVMRIPSITKAPDMPESVEGMVSLRGSLVPVIDLAKYTSMQTDTSLFGNLCAFKLPSREPRTASTACIACNTSRALLMGKLESRKGRPRSFNSLRKASNTSSLDIA